MRARISSLRVGKGVAAALLFALAYGPASAETNDLAGSYAGTYEASDPTAERGTWNATVAADGSLEGAAHSDVARRDFAVTGNVAADGAMAMSTGETSAGSTFTGMIGADGTVTGTWVNARMPDRYSGTFEGARE